MKFIILTIYLLFSSQLFAENSCKGIDKSTWDNCYGYQLYDNGKTYNKVFYKNGRKDGGDYRYFENGKIQSKGFYNNGKLEGKNISFDENGNILKEIFICKGSNTANWKNCTGIFFCKRNTAK